MKAYKEYLQYNIDLYNSDAKITKVSTRKGELYVSISYNTECNKIIDVPIGISYSRFSKIIFFHKKSGTIEVSYKVDKETIELEDKVIDFINRTKKIKNYRLESYCKSRLDGFK